MMEETKKDKNSWRFELDVEHSKVLTSSGTLLYPPMNSVPCSFVSSSSSNGPDLVLKEVIQPPSVDDLYDWYVKYNYPDADPSWAVVWPTAVSLMEYILDIELDLSKKHVLELGCGLGLVGLVCAGYGAEKVTLTDREPHALHCAMSTASINQYKNVDATLLDWTNVLSYKNLLHSVNIIVASDIFYDGDTIAQFATVCTQLLKHQNKEKNDDDDCLILISDPLEERFQGARTIFVETMQQKYPNFHMECIYPAKNNHETTIIEESFLTSDAKDHFRRMQEPTVILKCTFPSSSQHKKK